MHIVIFGRHIAHMLILLSKAVMLDVLFQFVVHMNIPISMHTWHTVSHLNWTVTISRC